MERKITLYDDDDTLMHEGDDDQGIVLMMKALDGCLDADERDQWQALIEAQPELAAEFRELAVVGTAMDAFRHRMLVEHRTRHAEISGDPAVRLSWVLIPLGLAMVWGFGFSQLLSSPEVPSALKLGSALYMAGAVLLFAKVVWDRLQIAPSDRYSEVDR